MTDGRPPLTPYRGPVNLISDAARTLGRVFADGARVLGAHWPQLVALFLAGWAGRMGVLWLTTVVSDRSPTLAILIIPFAPLATLLSMVLMLRAMAPTLSSFASVVERVPARTRWIDDLTVAAQVLIPFLAVYASAGLLRQDVRVFLYDATADEWLNANIQSMDFGRGAYADGWLLALFIVVALVIRKAITLLDLAERHVAWAAFATYVEALWLMTIASAMSSELANLTEWVTSRRAVAGLLGWWEALVEAVRAWSSWATSIVDSISTLLGNLGSLVVLPVAWLAIGAAVYGHSLKATELTVETHEDVARRIKKVPQPVRRALSHAVEPLTTPVQNTLGAIGKVASAGIVPMVLFCVVFVVVGQLEALVAEVMRRIIGPGDSLRQYALEPYSLMVERGFSFVVTLALLGAAVNIVVSSQRDAEPPAAPEADADADAVAPERLPDPAPAAPAT